MDIFRQSSPTRENMGLLAVMEALGEREKITQRELARETGLNLKKVDFCLHKLAEARLHELGVSRGAIWKLS